MYAPLLTADRRCAAGRPLVIAHRGASRQAPENTLPAFAAALALGVDAVEFDFQVAADGTLVVIHDSSLERTTNVRDLWGTERLAVADRGAVELATLEAGVWFAPAFLGTRLPTVAEARAAIAPAAVPLIERKSGSAHSLCSTLAAAGLADYVVVQSFDWQFLAICRQLAPQLAVAMLGEDTLTGELLDGAAALGAFAVAWDDAKTDARAIADIQRRGMRAWVWTVNDAGRQQQLLDWGVDGLITNDPAGLQRLIGRT